MFLFSFHVPLPVPLPVGGKETSKKLIANQVGVLIYTVRDSIRDSSLVRTHPPPGSSAGAQLAVLPGGGAVRELPIGGAEAAEGRPGALPDAARGGLRAGGGAHRQRLRTVRGHGVLPLEAQHALPLPGRVGGHLLRRRVQQRRVPTGARRLHAHRAHAGKPLRSYDCEQKKVYSLTNEILKSMFHTVMYET
eukprot:1178626-Prorocentrum_minimum.AAC.2